MIVISVGLAKMRPWFVLAAFVGCSIGAALASDTKNDFDPEADFTRFKTFAFVGGQELVNTGLLKDPEVRERIKNFIGGAMELRGLQEVPVDESPTLAVRYWVARRDRTDVSTTLSSALYPGPLWGGYPPYWGGPWMYYYEEYVVRNYVEGTLIIDLIDPASRELVWRTFLRQKIEDRVKAYEEAKRNLNRAFGAFPPSDKEREKMRRERKKLEARYRNR